MARKCPDWIAREDLIAAGMVGLIEAADRYDDTRRDDPRPLLRRGPHVPGDRRHAARDAVARVPAAVARGRARARADRRGRGDGGRVSPRVLVVDDDDSIRRAIASSLARAGFDVS